VQQENNVIFINQTTDSLLKISRGFLDNLSANSFFIRMAIAILMNNARKLGKSSNATLHLRERKPPVAQLDDAQTHAP
jgi:hypothetical protein